MIISTKTNGPHPTYVGYLHETNTIAFAVPPLVKQAQFWRGRDVMTESSLFVHVIYSLADAYCFKCVSAEQ